MASYSGPNPNFQSVGVFENLTCDGAIKTVPLEFDWSVNDTFEVDPLYAQQQGYLPGLGTLYFYNGRTTNAAGGATASDVLLTVSGTNQLLALPADTAGYLPILGPTPVKLNFVGSSNAATTQVILISALMPGFVYGV
jgi:hypothetical protein